MVITVISIILQLIVLPIGLYYLFVGFAGFLPIHPKERNNTDKTHTFALIIPAHNEETVIASLIKSLKRLDYPDDAYEIFVVADNCTDRTAQFAEEAGATVYEREDTKLRGKGYAMEWFFEKLFALERKFDYISVFDADNLVDSKFLLEMNKMANKGYKVVQGFLDSKNPYDSWISAAYSYCFWNVNRTFQLARYKLGMCCELSGTGFIISTDTLKELGWGATCLTEDMEFTMKLALSGEKAAFAYGAKVYDEKPITLAQSWRQRVRWMRGHFDVASRYFFKLIKRGITHRSWSCIDCAVYLVQPIRIISLGIITFFAYAQSFYPNGDLGFIQLSYIFGNSWVWDLIVLVQFLYLPFVIYFERHEFNLKMLWYFFTNIFYNLTWVPIVVQGFIERKRTDWSHTRHVKNIDIDEL